MGRTTTKGPEPVELQPLDGTALTAGQNLMAGHSAEVMTQFGDGLPYDRERLIAETRFYMGTAAEAMLESGKRLLRMKEEESHGEFIAICEERLGLSARTAQQMMQAAAKFLLSPQLAGKASALLPLGKAKLFELLAEDNDTLADLAEGGTLAGLALDDIDRMTSRELRKALREAREDAEATGRVMADKNAKIDALARELQKKPLVVVLEPDEKARELRKEVAAVAYEAETTLQGTLRAAFSQLNEAGDPEQHRTFQAALLRQLEITLAALRSEFHLPSLQDPDQLPAWQTLLGLDEAAEA
jgi:hypothetical protein